MNSKNSLLFVLAILFVVSQLAGEESTISSLALSDSEDLQTTIKKGEQVLEDAISPSRTTGISRSSPVNAAQSLDDFYGTDEPEEPAPTIEPQITDVDPEADDTTTPAGNNDSNVANSSVEYINSQPFGPRVQ